MEYSAKPTRQRRSRKACSRCHARKTRCDVQHRGIPCTSCIELSATCTIRPRKNARAPSITSPEPEPLLEAVPTAPQPPPEQHWTLETLASIWPNIHVDTSSPNNQLQTQNAVHADALSVGSASAGYDFATLADLEDIFSSTSNPFIELACHGPRIEAFGGDYQPGNDEQICVPLTHFLALDPDHRQFLQSQGCFTLPRPATLRQIMHLYFNYIHPNVPIVDESQVWAIWNSDALTLGSFSFLVMRAMIFTVAHFLSPDALLEIGYTNNRDARLAYYTQAKLLFDFNVERDPVANAQASLLLTYFSPHYNSSRVNSYWLVKAAHFARIARANSFHLVEDPNRARMLKRLWWCVLFRDRILSLALRRPLNVELDPVFSDEQYILQAIDFHPELGKSKVHDKETQLRLIEIMTSTCRLVQCLTPSLEILYHHERVDQRLTAVSRSTSDIGPIISSCLEALHSWHRLAIRCFPSPVTLDDTSGTVSIFANMLFCYYSSAMFALNLYCILLYETVSPSGLQVPFKDAAEALSLAMDDIGARMQELLQARLAKYLPISVSAYVSLPLVLQAINITAARGFGTQETLSIESRKLEVFTRILETQRQHFDGSDFVADILTNIVAYAKDNKYFASMSNPREGRDDALVQGQHRKSHRWPELVLRQPRLLLRLLLRLDSTLCTGGIIGEDDSLSKLRLAST